jgi:hypothetical protein
MDRRLRGAGHHRDDPARLGNCHDGAEVMIMPPRRHPNWPEMNHQDNIF